MKTFTIRTMQPRDAEWALGLAAQEGWNPGVWDAKSFFAADPDGFFIGELDAEPVGCISAVRYPDHFGFIGLYIVLPERRGQGFGQQLWRRALDSLDGRTIGLDAVLAQQDNYQKSGFQTAYRNMRYHGQGGGEPPANVMPLREAAFVDLLQYDGRCFPSSRERFLKAWLEQPGAFGYAAKGEKGLTGWGLIRPCGLGWKIGPLCADDARVAENLYLALRAHAPGQPVFLDVPQPHAAAMDLAARYAMTPVFETARMYRGTPAPLELQKVFGVASFELG